MSSFTEVLLVSPLADGKQWVVRKQFKYDVGEEGSGDSIIVEPGFITDFTSVPKILFSMFPPWSKYGSAAIIHDYLYWTQERTRKEADDIFLEGMEVLGVGKFTRWAIYRSVRDWGWMAYKNNKKAKDKGETRMIPVEAGYIRTPKMNIKVTE